MKTLRLSADGYLIFQHQHQLDSELQSQVAKIKIIFFKKFKTNIFYSLYTHQIYTYVVQLVRMLKVFKAHQYD